MNNDLAYFTKHLNPKITRCNIIPVIYDFPIFIIHDGHVYQEERFSGHASVVRYLFLQIDLDHATFNRVVV